MRWKRYKKGRGKPPKRRAPSRPLLESLEPRLLLSADFAPALADALVADDAAGVAEASSAMFLDLDDGAIAASADGGPLDAPTTPLQTDALQDLAGVLAPVPDGETASLLASADAVTGDSALIAAESIRYELVFVDPRAPDSQQLANADSSRQIDVVLLDVTQDGVAQVTETLAGYQGLDAVHLVSHGGAGSVQLGGSALEFDTLLANAQAIQGWGAALDGGADILIYGCDLAATADGRALVDSLSRLTGADVAASDDLTGSAALGGDWELEYVAGEVETAVAVGTQVQANWAGLLAKELWITEKSSLPVEEFTPTTLEPVGGVTSGSFAGGFDIQNFTGAGKEVWATHYVTQTVTIGTGTTLTYFPRIQIVPFSDFLVS